MWIWRRLKWKLYDIKNFFYNIWWYRKFLITDRKWENDSIITVLKLRLQKTVEYYNQGLDLPYVGWEEDRITITRAYHLAQQIDLSNTNVEQELTMPELEKLHNEFFNLLKQYRQWWD